MPLVVAPPHTPVPLPDWREKSVYDMRADAGAFLNAIANRRTVRDFDTRPVPRDIIETCIRAAGTAPNGANHQPWHFVAISDPARRSRIRAAAEAEERTFHDGKGGEEWIRALAPLGADPSKPFLEDIPWLISVFVARRSASADGVSRKNCYVPESVSIATGFLILAPHHAGLVSLTHTPAPVGFLNGICGRPSDENPYILMVTGYAKRDASVPVHALEKKPLDEVATFL